MVIKEGYKQTEIGVIPIDWEVRTFDELTDKIIGGGTPSRSNSSFWGNEIPWVTVKDFATFNPFTTQEYITKIGLQNSASHLIPKGIIITSTRMALGKAVIYDIDVSINQDLKAIYPKNIIDTNFFYYWFQFNAKKIEELGSGSTVMGLSLPDLRKIKLKIPTHKEQTAIATALSDADGLITGLEKLIAKKRNIKQGAMQQLLQPKEGWVVKKLGEVASIVRGASPRPIEDAKWFDNQSPIGWVRISDVTKSKKVLNETTQTLSDLGVKNSRLVENGNLIMSICATVGRPILTTFDVCIHDGFVVFRNPQIDKEYLYYFLTFIEDNWSKSGQTGSQMNLNTALINNTEIPFPNSNEEQTRIANIFSDMDAELSALEQKLEKYKKVKLGMMQELLTGKTRLN